MSTAPGSGALLLWLTPSLIALFLYGIGQGLVKKYIGEVPPARFCLYFVLARSIVFLGYFAFAAYFAVGGDRPSLLAADGHAFLSLGVLAYNARARRCYEKCGFREEGRVREHRFHDGRWHDQIIMGILQHEFERDDT